MKFSRNVTRVFARLSNLIYPRRCPICDGLIGSRKLLVCPECRARLQPAAEPACKRCGKPLLKEEQEYCEDCARKKHSFVRGRAAFVYDARMRGSIARFKYHNRREYADFYAQELLKRYGAEVRQWAPEAVIPIPIHRSRRRKRGFNQAELIARKLGKALDLPVESHLLVRRKKTQAQKNLGDAARALNLKNAFQVRGNDVKLKRVLLVDDIYTTGSTIDAAAAALKKRGVEKIYFLTVCIGRGY